MGHDTGYLDYGGLPHRIMTAVIGMFGASVWSMYCENKFDFIAALWHNRIFAVGTSTASKIWPPSAESAPTLIILILIFGIKVKKTFFQHEETAQIKRVRETKRRLLLAQMTQALRWDEREQVEDDDKESEADGDADATKKRKPPSAADLFDMLYDDVEERHVTDYGISADSEPYLSTLALFKERLAADFKDYVKFTNLARCQAKGEDIPSMDTEMDNAQMKRIPEFLDGTKLAELVDLFTKKVRKAFGKSILDHALLQAAQKCKSDLCKEQRKGVSMLWPHLHPILPMYAFAVCLMIFDAANGTVVYHSSKALLDEVGDGNVTVKELGPLVLQTYIKFTFCVFAHLSSWAFTHKVTAEFRLSVRNEIMANMVRQDMKFFDFYPSGILQERLNNDAEQLSSKMFQLPVRLIECFVRLSSCVLMLYSLDPQLFSVVAFPVPVIAVACNFIIRYMQTLQQRQRKIGESAAATTMEVLKEIRTVREFAMEGEESEKFAANSSYRAHIEQYANAMHHIVLIAPLFCLFEGMRFLCTYLGGCFVAGGQLKPGQAVMAAGLAGDMTHIVRSFFDIVPEIVKTLQPLGRVCDMLSAKPQIEPHPGSESKLKPEKIEGAVEFINVNFTFPSEPLQQVLFNLSWSVSPGEKIGFVGGTGCGKSTSLYLIERWYNPQSGSILLDGRKIADYDVHHLRRHMSVVAQTTCLFSTTIRENLVYGLPYETRKSISDREIEEALKQANAWDFVNEFPRKLETYAGERGVKLSGGQKQRLAIARALIRKPTIILLDEATSALDSKAEAVVQKALDKMIDENAKGCSIIIAHRLSTLRTCNRILVMDKGSVKESGSHDELMRIKVQKDSKGNMITGWYRDLYETQHGKNEAAGELLKVQFELELLKKKLAAVTQENVHLKEDAVKTFKLSKSRHVDQMLNELVAPPTLCLVRHTSETCPTNIDDVVPQPLTIERARTTPAW